MTIGIIITITALVIVIGYVLWQKRKEEEDKPDYPTDPIDPNPPQEHEICEFMGEANPSQPSGEQACQGVMPHRKYYSGILYTPMKLKIGDYLYNKFPDEKTNGFGNWIYLEGITTENQVVKVESDGRISDVFEC